MQSFQRSFFLPTDPVWLAVTVGLTAVLLAIAAIDLRTRRIPDTLSLPLLAAGLAVAWVWPGLTDTRFPDHLIGAAAGFALFAAIGEVIFRRTGQEALGLGDAKLFGAAGAWLGWQALPPVLLIASLTGLGLAMLTGRAQRGAALAFGPWIALGFLAVWVWGAVG